MSDTPAERGAAGWWGSLRRRKVVQWGLLYIAAAWGLLQGLEYVSDAFAWPPAVRQVALLAALVGLPIALVLAWYHGDRGEQRFRSTELAIIALLLLLGGGIFWRYERAGGNSTNPSVAAANSKADGVATDSRPSIAVLPFENRSDENKDVYFVDGIHDDILTQLTKIGALKVIARTSVEQFRDTNLTTREIGEKLGVTKVLEGGVQRAGDRVRVTVQLIDAATDAHLWAESYDRELTAANIFAIQSEVASAISVALKTTLTPAERELVSAIPTQNFDAWEAYQLGRQRMASRISADLDDAEHFFRNAIDLDPRFALAYVGLADTLSLQVLYSGAPRETNLSNAEKAVAEALRLAPELAEAWASSGYVAANRDQYDRSESMLRRAIDLNANYAPARHWYYITLRTLGRPDEGLAQIQRAVELDPLSPVFRENLGAALEQQGRFHEAEASYRRALAIDPSRPGPYMETAFLHAYALNRFTDAVPTARKAIELDTGSPWLFSFVARLYWDLADDNAASRITAEAAQRWPGEPSFQLQLALQDLLRRDAAAAVRHAQRSLEADPRSVGALTILRNADLQNGRPDAALMRYEKAYPDLFVLGSPRIDSENYLVGIDLALVFERLGDAERAGVLLDGAAPAIRRMPRLGYYGHGIADVQIYALRNQKRRALATLREAEQAGWRNGWRYHRDLDPNLASIRNEPQFKAVFADIERDMARQRAALAKRPKEAPLDLASTGT